MRHHSDLGEARVIMASYWLLKTEPSTYSFADLVRDQRTTWDGVSNPAALGFLRQMKKGDQAFIYHTGAEKSIVGIARLTSDSYPDPKLLDPKRAVVDLAPVRALREPVPLARVKADKGFAELGLVRFSRLSVMPIPAEQWEKLLAIAGDKALPNKSR